MSINDKILAAEESLNAIRDELQVAVENADDSQESIDLRKGLQDRFDRAEENLNLLKSHEQAVAEKSEPVVKAAPIVSKSAPAVVKSSHRKGGEADLIVKSAAAALIGHIERKSVDQVIAERFSDDDRVKAVSSLTKAATNAALSNVAGWAQELTQESVGAFMDEIAPQSVLPRLGLATYSFNGASKIVIPNRASGGKLSGAFRAEGAPIPVKQASFGSKSLTPKHLGVISAFSNEIVEMSTPSIVSLIRTYMQRDSAEALDGAFLGAATGSATVPAGIQTYATGSNTAASAGANHSQIVSDLRGRMQQLASQNLGARPVFIMNPARATGLELALTATGSAAFPTVSSGSLLGAPVVTSTTVPADVVYLIDASEVAVAMGAPRFAGSDVATLHFEDTTPEQISSAGTPNTVAAPVRSLFQHNEAAIRMTMDLDWTCLRDGAVQTITAVAW